VVLVVSALTGFALAGAPEASAGPARGTYQNPVSKSFADTFADPSIIEAKDGWWYAYSTADPLRSGDDPGIMHIARTRNFVDWDYRGTVFDESNRPTWATETSGLWAPDVRYIDGRYVLYYTVTDTTLNPGDDSAIGVATAPTPTGPWTPGDAPVVAPRPAGDGFLWTFDPSGFTDVDGQRYLYYGSYFGGVFVSRVSEDGLTAVGDAQQVAINDKFEGSYVVRHGSYYYFMASSANCCAGPATGYSLFSGRSRSPMGPFVDADGIPLTASRAGGTILTTQNGNRWIGAGHHAIATDHAGRDFVVYHALDRNEPWLTEPVQDVTKPLPINRRPMLIDRIDWIDGWPRTRAGAGPSDSPQPAPVTGTDLGIRSDKPAARGFRGLDVGPRDRQAGTTALLRGSARTTENVVGQSVRLRLDLRGNRPLEVELGQGQDRVRVGVDQENERLTVRSGTGRSTITRSDDIELDSDRWHTLVVEVDRTRVLAQLSEDDLNDPYAEVRLTDRDLELRSAPLRLRSSRAVVDNISLRRLAVEAKRLVPVPKAGALIHAESFNGPLDDDDWTWVRRDSDATVASGALRWPLQSADLVGPGNTAGVLLSDRTPDPDGTWMAETKLRLDLGETTVRNYQQAGLIAYEDDDDFARLSSVAIWNTRQVEFGRELAADPGKPRTVFAGAIIGTPAAEMWMRLAHTRNAAGEHLYRAAISRDGKSWTWGAVWTLPASADPKIGLIAHGGENPPVTAEFSYLRFYRTTWPAVE
jgi:beta-xylosidase